MINKPPIASLVPTIVRILLPSSGHHPSYICDRVINLPHVPSFPNLVSLSVNTDDLRVLIQAKYRSADLYMKSIKTILYENGGGGVRFFLILGPVSTGDLQVTGIVLTMDLQ